jgi:hypothetical protein
MRENFVQVHTREKIKFKFMRLFERVAMAFLHVSYNNFRKMQRRQTKFEVPTIKAAVLEGDLTCPSIVCMSYYDAKDVFFYEYRGY